MNDNTLVERQMVAGDIYAGTYADLNMQIAALQSRIEALEAALRKIAGGAKTGEEMFKERLGDRKSPTWFAVNVLQDSLAACHGTAERALESQP